LRPADGPTVGNSAARNRSSKSLTESTVEDPYDFFFIKGFGQNVKSAKI